jgi:transposase-like protein
LDTGLEFRSSIFTDEKVSILVNYKDTTEIVENSDKIVEDIIEEHLIDFETLKKKRKKINLNIEMAIQTKKNSHKNISIPIKTNINENINFCDLKKFKCKNCKTQPNYKIEEISSLKSERIKNELYLHGHPKSRRINKKERTLAEAKEELKEHYLNIHNLK